MHLIRSHGLGNDYLVLTSGEPMSPARARALCDRHHGVGSDGVLEPLPSETATAGLRIWNPDGSLAEKSGNGLRIFAWFLHRHRAAGAAFSVELHAPGPVGTAHCTVFPSDHEVEVDMGRATLTASAIPALGPLDREALALPSANITLPCTALGLGNPHCVVFVDDLADIEGNTPADLDALPWRAWGAALEVHPHFPNRTNVQFARVCGPAAVEARIWERGAGETLASGSSACAVAAAAVHHGRLLGPTDADGGRQVAVSMPGGLLRVWVGPGLALRQRGPVEELAAIETRWTVPL